jgi:hypothetical protein
MLKNSKPKWKKCIRQNPRAIFIGRKSKELAELNKIISDEAKNN